MKDIPRKRNSIEFKVWGAYALFSDPITRIGGEKFSYQTPTYEALKGIVESIYWKPTIIWFVDAVRVMKPIRTEAKGIKTVVMDGSKPSDLSFYTYLKVIGKDETGLVFECMNLDEETHLCKIHKHRPGICRRYPQEELFLMGGTLAEHCGYNLEPIESFEEVFQKISKKSKDRGYPSEAFTKKSL